MTAGKHKIDGPLRLDSLPRAPAAEGSALIRRAAALLSVSMGAWQTTVPPLGRLVIRYLGVFSPGRLERGQIAWVLVRSGREGRLVFDGFSALLMVASVLGLPAPRITRQLGAWERGIFAAVAANVFADADTGISVSLRSNGSFGEALVRIEIAIDIARFHARAFLDVPADWIPPPRPRLLADAAVARDLVVTVAIELARTTLPVSEWAAVVLGDAVVFDGHAAPGTDASWPVRIMCGPYAAGADLGWDGTLCVRGAFTEDRARSRPATHETATHKSAIGRTETMPPTITDQVLATTTKALAAAPMEVVAEIGRVELRADELLGLRPGAVLPLGPLGPTTVDLRAGGRSWARGELIEVDGQLGVRVTQLEQEFDGGIAPPPAEDAHLGP